MIFEANFVSSDPNAGWYRDVYYETVDSAEDIIAAYTSGEPVIVKFNHNTSPYDAEVTPTSFGIGGVFYSKLIGYTPEITMQSSVVPAKFHFSADVTKTRPYECESLIYAFYSENGIRVVNGKLRFEFYID